MIEIESPGVPIKAWTEGVPFEPQAQEQLRQIATLPFVGPHVAVMPDVHLGIGATVGSVIPTVGALIPAAVGVDIGCGVHAVRTSLFELDIHAHKQKIYDLIADYVPHGSAKGKSEIGSHSTLLPMHVAATARPLVKLAMAYDIINKMGMDIDKIAGQLGTLGGGNHFIEVCVDEESRVWIMIHSGSRGIGNKIGTYYTDAAKTLAEQNGWKLPNQDLGYLPEEHPLFSEYYNAMMWAQDYALANRQSMMLSTIQMLRRALPTPFDTSVTSIDAHHNYVERTEALYITRKGAVSARLGEYGVIPGSMGAKSFVVKGKGNRNSFCSCSHGAGRVMSRSEAKRTITHEQHLQDTSGVICRTDDSVLDESPRAYKNIDDVMRAQSDLVEVVHTLKQVLCVKG